MSLISDVEWEEYRREISNKLGLQIRWIEIKGKQTIGGEVTLGTYS